VTVELWWSEKIKKSPADFKAFAQKMANRLLVGALRYGPAKKEQNYMTRLEMEFKAYKKTGNGEFLVNIANYALLESIAPQNSKYHYDAHADSVTRKKMGV